MSKRASNHFFEALAAALSSIEHEIVLVDDGSTDGTVAKIEANRPPNLKLVVLNKNYGQTTAMAAGIDEASGELICKPWTATCRTTPATSP